MKIILCLSFSLLLINPAFGQALDTPGFSKNFEINTGGYVFELLTTANFDVVEVQFSSEDKKLTLFINSALENNLGEIQIPINLINGNFTFFLNDQEFFPNVKTSERISFITIEFQGDGRSKLEIIGTTYLPEFSEIAPLVLAASLIGFLALNRTKKIIRPLFFK